jgi:multidrug efflux system membrane fusion protein
MRIMPALLLLSCAHASDPEAELASPPVPVETAPVRVEPVFPTLHGAGRLAAADEVTLSFPSGGVVSRIVVEAGDRVQRGQLLAVLDATAARARLEGARSSAEKAERDFARASALEGTALARQNREDATTGLEVARATLQAAEFEVRRSVLVAPGDGVVLSRHAEPEQTVAPGTPVLRLATDHAWEVEISLPAAQALRVQPGEPATVRLAAYPGRTFEGRVARRAGGATRLGSWSVWVTLDPVDVPLASGLVAAADLAPATPPLPVVPLSALTEVDGTQAAVYTVQDGLARRVPVEIVWLVGDEVALASPADLSEVITVGTTFVRDGAPVVR